MENVISAMLTLFGIMLTGFLAERTDLFPKDMQLCLNRFVYWVSFPALIFTQTAGIRAGAETLRFMAAFASAAVLCALASFFSLRLFLRASSPAAAARTLQYAQPNAAFLGIPFVAMVMPGSESVFAATLASILYTLVVLPCDACMGLGEGPSAGPMDLRPALKQALRNPNLLACAAGCAFPLFDCSIPAPLMRIGSMLGSTAAPCALFSIGMLLAEGLLRSGGFPGVRGPAVAAACAAKLLLHPAATCAVLLLFGCTGTQLAAGTLSAAMPTAVIVYVICERHGTCASESSLVIILSTILSVFTLPAVLLLLRMLGAC